MSVSKKESFLSGIRDGFPIAMGYFAVSFTLGISAANFGLNAIQSGLMSFLQLASAGEYATLSVIGERAPYYVMAITILIVNLRYFLFSCSLSQKLVSGACFIHRFFVGMFVTDEIFAIGIAYGGEHLPVYLYGAAAVAAPAWTAGTALGSVVGAILPERLSSAFAVALYGMFLAIIIPKAKKERFIGLIVAVSMLLSAASEYTPVVNEISGGFRIIILTIAIAAVSAIIRPVKDEENGAAAVAREEAV